MGQVEKKIKALMERLDYAEKRIYALQHKVKSLAQMPQNRLTWEQIYDGEIHTDMPTCEIKARELGKDYFCFRDQVYRTGDGAKMMPPVCYRENVIDKMKP